MNIPKRVALGVTGCFFAALFFVSLRGCDYVDRQDGFEIAVTRTPLLAALAGSHGKSEQAELRIGGTEFRMLAGRSPHCIEDQNAKWMVCVATETWPASVIIIIDKSSRKFATTESPLSGFGAFIGDEDNPHTVKYDRESGSLTLTDARLNRSALLNDFNWRKY